MTEQMKTSEIMMSVPESNAMMQLILQFMRNQSDQSQRIEDRLTGTDTLLLDVRERLIKMEQADHAAQIRSLKENFTSLEVKIKKLEDESIERRGMQKLVDWFVRYGWILLGIVAVVTWAIGERGGK